MADKSKRPVQNNTGMGKYQRGYTGGPAKCKYCHITHSNWHSADDYVSAVWVCEKCKNVTHDSFMFREVK